VLLFHQKNYLFPQEELILSSSLRCLKRKEGSENGEKGIRAASCRICSIKRGDIMKRLRSGKTALIIVIALSLFFDRSPGNAGTREEGWYEVFFRGDKIGFEHYSLEKTSFRGVPAWRVKDSSEGHVTVEGRDSIMRTDSVSYFGLDMTPFYSRGVTHEKEQVTTTEVTVSSKEITIRKKLGDSETMKKLPYRKGYTFGVNGPLLLYKGLSTGRHYTVQSINDEKYTIEQEKVEILKEEPFHTGKGRILSFLVRVESTALPGVPLYINIDREGRILQTKTIMLTTRRSDEKSARTFTRVSTYSNRIYTGEKFPVPDTMSKMELSLSLRGVDPGALLETCAYQSSELKGKNLEVTLHEIRPEEKLLKSPLKEKERALYLAPSIMIESKDPLIVAKSREIAGTEENREIKVRLLCSWVFSSLVKEDSSISMESAAAALREGKGDCTEHSVLFCALARAQGIPARQVCGLVFTGDSFGFHAWAEAWCGQWVPVDATNNRVGFPAAYIKLGDNGEGKPTIESTVRLIKLLGGTSIKIKEVTIDGHSLLPGDPSTFIEIKGNTCTHRLWGIHMEKPDRWKWKWQSAEQMVLEGPEQAQIIVMPLFIMAKSDLAQVASLMKGLIGNESQSLSFGASTGRSIGFYTISETPFNVTIASRAYRGAALMLSGNGKTLFFLLLSPPRDMDKNEEDLEKILESSVL
jgi:hypothetical protein